MLRRKIMMVLALVIGATGIYLCWPRKADLRAFDPAAMARLETAMWRDYYERHYPRLFYHLHEGVADAVRLLAAGRFPDCAVGSAGSKNLSAGALAAGGRRGAASCGEVSPAAAAARGDGRI
jgi:hypothetical protein